MEYWSDKDETRDEEQRHQKIYETMYHAMIGSEVDKKIKEAEKKATKFKKTIKKGAINVAKNFLRKTPLLAGLALYYTFTGPTPSQTASKLDYELPTEIRITDTSLPFTTRETTREWKSDDGKTHKTIDLEKIIRTQNIDFSKDFWIKTDRYMYVKDQDWWTSRVIGHVMTVPGKLLFMDWNYGLGQDEHRARASLSMVETHKEIKDITIRVNHNEALYDMKRMFTEDKLTERNNFIARATIGTLASLGDEVWAEFFRGSYYNPMTKTAVCYSNVESILAHEIGHHKDYQRFDSDWEYGLAKLFPPVTLYKEWQASQYAKTYLSDADKYQFNRYLLPAFLTYLIAGYAVSKRMIRKKDVESDKESEVNLIGEEIDKLERTPEISKLQSYYTRTNKEKIKGFKNTLKSINRYENNMHKNTFEDIKKHSQYMSKIKDHIINSRITMPQVIRHYTTINLNLLAGIGAYNYCNSIDPTADFKYAGFAIGLVLAHKATNSIMKKIIPYTHELNNLAEKKTWIHQAFYDNKVS